MENICYNMYTVIIFIYTWNPTCNRLYPNLYLWHVLFFLPGQGAMFEPPNAALQ